MKRKQKTEDVFKYVLFSELIAKRLSVKLSTKESLEMEFLGINLTEDLSLLLHAILQKTILNSGFKNPSKKPMEDIEFEYIHEKPFVEEKNEGKK